MNIEEEISERIIRQAFEGGGEVIFTDTELKECTDRNLLQKVNLQLSLYGAINDNNHIGQMEYIQDKRERNMLYKARRVQRRSGA